jgi:TonB-linked SusC/RagA family outer membrane protein
MKKSIAVAGKLRLPLKPLIYMKLTLLLSILCIFNATAGTHAQTVSLKTNKTEIAKVLGNIEQQGGFRFLFNSRLKDLKEKVNLDVNNAAIETVLNQLFAGTSLTYKILSNNLIAIRSVNPDEQDIKITGKIVNEKGEPLSGVSISIKGTSKGTVTDNNGNYTLNVAPNAVLIISYIGYTTQEVSVNNQNVINVSLVASEKQLDQVVVVGYGTQRKQDVTGSIATIKGSEISKQASVNPISALQGKVAGVQITNSGAPGSAPQINIRGLGTYWSNTGPLYVVDGVWLNDVNFLNPADIQSISILKDASSEAIYGIKGANGVVIITTKKGTGANRKPVVNYNGYVGYQKATNQVKMADAYQYAVLFNELGRMTGATNFLDSSKFGTGTNWFDQVLRNAIITNHQVSVTGGTDKNTYNFSLGYLTQQGILKTNDYTRYTANLSNDIQVSKNIKAGYTVIGNFNNSHNAPGGIWHALYAAPPVLPVKFADGVTYGDPGYYGLGSAVSNPQATLDYNNSYSRGYNFTGNAYVDIRIARHFDFKSTVSGVYGDNESKNYVPVYKATSTQQNSVSSLGVSRGENRSWIAENTITYSNTFATNHRVTILAGQHAEWNNYNFISASAQNVPNVNSGNWFLGLGNNPYVNDVDNSYNQQYPLQSTISSYFGRINYAFKNKYMLNATMRADGSSKFTGSERWGYFPSIGAAWIVSQENFMRNQHIFNSLKLKASWGKVGNAGVPTFVSTQQTVSGGAYSVIYGNSGTVSQGVSVASIPPPPLKWEKSVGTDIGLEAAVLNSRLTIEADVYNKKTQDIIMNVYLPGSAGLANQFITTNVGDAQNQGFELSLNWHDNVSKDFSYSISGNISYNENKFLTNSAGGQKIYDGGSGATGGQFTTLTTVGQPIGVFYGYKVVGIFQTAADVANYKDKSGNLFQPNAQPGDFKYASTTGVGPISANDRVVLGNPNPKYIYGISTNFVYKQFDLSLDFQGVAGVDVYNANKGLRYGAENWTLDFYNNRWHGANTSNSYPSVNIGGGNNYWPNSWYVESGSYFRIRNMQLGYTLPNTHLQHLGIQTLRVYVNAQNAFNFFSYKGFSPEVGGSPGNIGIDNNTYPLSAIYNFGVNLSF